MLGSPSLLYCHREWWTRLSLLLSFALVFFFCQNPEGSCHALVKASSGSQQLADSTFQVVTTAVVPRGEDTDVRELSLPKQEALRWCGAKGKFITKKVLSLCWRGDRWSSIWKLKLCHSTLSPLNRMKGALWKSDLKEKFDGLRMACALNEYDVASGRSIHIYLFIYLLLEFVPRPVPAQSGAQGGSHITNTDKSMEILHHRRPKHVHFYPKR